MPDYTVSGLALVSVPFNAGRGLMLGYACPATMGAFWWYDPMLAGDTLLASRGVPTSGACCQPAIMADV